MKKNILGILFLVGIIHSGISQTEKNLVGKFTFNHASLLNEINGRSAKALSVSIVADRFGNEDCAVFLHGGNGSYITLGTDSILKPVKGTIAIWINMEEIIYRGSGYEINPIILAKNTNTDDFFEAYCIMYHYNSHRFSASAGITEQEQLCIFSKQQPVRRKWQHLVMTYDDDSAHFYINGVLEARILKNFRSRFSKTDSVMVGHTANRKNRRYFNGSVDDIYIYNRVLTEQEIKQLYEQPNPNRAAILVKWIFTIIGGIFGVSLIVLFFIHRQKKIFQKEKERIFLKTRLQEMETRAIRLQMNPHFIFNTLNSLQRIILEGNIVKANNYLSEFSKMLRRILENYDSDNISLAEELEILNIYLNIEKLRFGNSFEYLIQSDIKNPEAVFIPFMLIQPIVENAIWHGLLPKTGPRKLTVGFTDNSGFITCTVDDNGVGIDAKKPETIWPSKKRSMAIDFIKQRLFYLTAVTHVHGKISIVNKRNHAGDNEGTLVELIIPKR